MSTNDYAPGGINVSVEPKEPKEPAPSVGRVSAELIVLVGLLVSISVAPAVVIAAWRFFL